MTYHWLLLKSGELVIGSKETPWLAKRKTWMVIDNYGLVMKGGVPDSEVVSAEEARPPRFMVANKGVA